MKTNKKVLAGALALALGLGSVVPAFAEGGKKVTASKNDSGIVVIDKDYRAAEEKYVEAYNNLEAAKKNTDEKQAAFDEAKKAEEEAEKALKDFEDNKDALKKDAQKHLQNVETNVADFLSDKAIADSQDKNVQNAAKKLNDDVLKLAGDLFNPLAAPVDLANIAKDTNALLKALPKTDTQAENTAQKEAANAVASLDLLGKDLKELAEKYNTKKENECKTNAARKYEALQEATNNLTAAKKDQVVAQGKYDVAKKAFIKAGADAETIAKYEKEGVKPDDTEPATVDEKIAKLEASLKELNDRKYGLEYLKKIAGKIVAKHQAEYDALVAEVNDKIKTTEAAIEALKKPKTALLFSTVYADEDADSVDVDQILKENDETIKKVDDFMKKLNDEADQEDDNKPDKPDQPDNPDKPNKPDQPDQPSDTDNKPNKPADDNKKPVKPADNNEKPANNNTNGKNVPTTVVVKKSNPKTGVAGVAGVAAVLAAASAAYADTKKRK